MQWAAPQKALPNATWAAAAQGKVEPNGGEIRISAQASGRIVEVLAQVNDKFTMIRSMSYTPNGLFNHTAAIYQMMTGYTTDKVSPSGQLEPPTPKDFPNFGSNIIRIKPPTAPMLPFVMLPRPLQESGVVGKSGTAGFLGRAFDPYYLYPPGDDMDMSKMDRISIDDLELRPEVTSARLERRARLRDMISRGMPEIDKAVAKYDLNEYYDKALSLIISGRAREAFNLRKESDAMRERDWVGRSLRLGHAGLDVVMECPRCTIIAAEQAGGIRRDARITRTIVRTMRQCISVYCNVRQPGRVTVGDELTV